MGFYDPFLKVEGILHGYLICKGPNHLTTLLMISNHFKETSKETMGVFMFLLPQTIQVAVKEVSMLVLYGLSDTAGASVSVAIAPS